MASTVVQFTVVRPPTSTTSTTAPPAELPAHLREASAVRDTFTDLLVGVLLLLAVVWTYPRRNHR